MLFNVQQNIKQMEKIEEFMKRKKNAQRRKQIKLRKGREPSTLVQL